jgi:hypothetical protein
MKKKALYFLILQERIETISREQGPSLQQYFVEKRMTSRFLSSTYLLKSTICLKKHYSPRAKSDC